MESNLIGNNLALVIPEGRIGDYIKIIFNDGTVDAENNWKVLTIGWIALVFLLVNVMIFFEPFYFAPIVVAYILAEGFNLARINKQWRLLKEYIVIGWMKRYAYFAGFLYGMIIKRWIK